MTEEQRLRFLRRALGDGLLTVEEYEGLKPRMTCRSGDVMPEDGDAGKGSTAAEEVCVRLIRCVADAVLAVVPEEHAPDGGQWEVVVFEEAAPNAFALPGGKIGVHTGMLSIAVTPDQLAAVLGHEVGHVLLRHGNERMSQAILADTALQAGAVAAGQLSPGYRDAVVGGLGVGAQYGVILPFSRKHESEADHVGQTFMAQAGFDPAASVALWENMAKMSGGQPAEWQSTHPGHETRIALLNQQLPASQKEYDRAQAAGKNPNCGAPPAQD